MKKILFISTLLILTLFTGCTSFDRNKDVIVTKDKATNKKRVETDLSLYSIEDGRLYELDLHLIGVEGIDDIAVKGVFTKDEKLGGFKEITGIDILENGRILSTKVVGKNTYTHKETSRVTSFKLRYNKNNFIKVKDLPKESFIKVRVRTSDNKDYIVLTLDNENKKILGKFIDEISLKKTK